MSRSARIALLLVAVFLCLSAVILDLTGVAVREWWQLALPGVVAAILVFLLIREVRVR